MCAACSTSKKLIDFAFTAGQTDFFLFDIVHAVRRSNCESAMRGFVMRAGQWDWRGAESAPTSTHFEIHRIFKQNFLSHFYLFYYVAHSVRPALALLAWVILHCASESNEN